METTKEKILKDLNEMYQIDKTAYYNEIIRQTKLTLKVTPESNIKENLDCITLMYEKNTARRKELDMERTFLETMKVILQNHEVYNDFE
jgi:hypothetical protein